MNDMRILIVEGNRADTNARSLAAGGKATGEGYADVLRGLDAAVSPTILRPIEGERLPAGTALGDFDGIVWTGSALNIYDINPAVRAQLDLADEILKTGIPIFGSCWGLQVIVTALGGKVRLNPRGREIGVGRYIRQTEAGRAHPLYRHKPQTFDAMTVHMDEIETAPEGSVVLAGNATSRVQALAIENERVDFWGVQYHPEFSIGEMAAIFRRYGSRLVEAGFFTTEEQLNAFADDLVRLDSDPAANWHIAWRYGYTDCVTDPRIRLRELDNWLTAKVRPRAGQRHAAA